MKILEVAVRNYCLLKSEFFRFLQALGKLVYFMQQTAQGDGLLFKDMFLSQSSPDSSTSSSVGSIKDIVLSVDLLGSYQALEGFIVSLEESSRIFEVTNISFGSQSGSSYSFSLQIKTHSY